MPAQPRSEFHTPRRRKETRGPCSREDSWRTLQALYRGAHLLCREQQSLHSRNRILVSEALLLPRLGNMDQPALVGHELFESFLRRQGRLAPQLAQGCGTNAQG